MKKYLFGISALALAIAFSAFTKPSTNLSTAFFEYKGNFTDVEAMEADQDDIEEVRNWEYISVETGCDLGNEEDVACVIRLTEEYYDDSPTPQINTANVLSELKPEIAAKLSDLYSGDGVYVVDGSEGDVDAVFNFDVD